MTDEKADAYKEAEDAARRGAADLIERVADKIGMHVGAKAVFGEPVERDGVTVIPVAQTIIGTGAGSGASADNETGAGGGGGTGGTSTSPSRVGSWSRGTRERGAH